MEFLTLGLPSLTPIQNHPKSHKPISKTASILTIPFKNPNSHKNHLSFPCKTPKTTFHLLNSFFNKIPTLQTLPISLPNHFIILNASSLLKTSSTHVLNTIQTYLLIPKTPSFLKIPTTHLSNFNFKTESLMRDSLKLHISLSLMAISVPLPAFATETVFSSDQVSDKINIESILIAIDDFFNRYPFFVASIAFIWLVVIPKAQHYLKKFKFTSAFDAYQMLRDDPNTQLLDIRNKQSLMYLGSPNLKIMKKSGVHVEFLEGGEEAFVKEVLKNFNDPGNTTICVLDNFDGNSLKVAEMLFKSGFKEAYAIKGGLRGKNGWQEIQENLLPPSLHVYPRKKKERASQKLNVAKERLNNENSNNGKKPSSTSIHQDGNKKTENGYIKPRETTPRANISSERPCSPYPNVQSGVSTPYETKIIRG